MPVTPTYPGVYIEEIDSGVRTIVGIATSITAFLGRAPSGPVDEPTTISNYGEFERRFGGLHVDHPMSYAVRDFFLSGGSQALIVRLYKPADEGTSGCATASHGDLTLEAASPGTWGNQLWIAVDHDGIDEEVAKRYDLEDYEVFFNLTVRQGRDWDSPDNEERHLNVTFAESRRRVDRVLEQSSNLVRVQGEIDTSASRPDANPDDPVQFEEGLDSESLTEAGDYTGSEDDKTGLHALEKADLFNLLCIPPDTRNGDVDLGVYPVAMRYCVRRRAMLIVDSPTAWEANPERAAATAVQELAELQLTGQNARNAALYFPRVKQADPLLGGQIDTFPPCGIVAGIMARTDVRRGVWKAPAGVDDGAISGIRGLGVNLTDEENGRLNPLGINCLRHFRLPIGNVVWGARTLRGADQLADDYKYLPVRRLALYIEESLFRGTQWVVFEPNDEPLWAQIRLNVGAFMHDLFRQGAFQGSTPRDAYLVKCDGETTTQYDIDRGIVNIVVGFAPLKPAEFVIIKLQQIALQTEI